MIDRVVQVQLVQVNCKVVLFNYIYSVRTQINWPMLIHNDNLYKIPPYKGIVVLYAVLCGRLMPFSSIVLPLCVFLVS